MNIDELVKYRFSRAEEALEEAHLLASENHWNATANRLYYSCFYLVNALLLKKNKNFASHNGVKNEFHKSFVKAGIVSFDSGKLYNRLFNLRQEGDYLDFKRLEKEDVYPFLEEVESFFSELKTLLDLN
jgi:uncharacterized protein (UPF0332 family)